MLRPPLLMIAVAVLRQAMRVMAVSRSGLLPIGNTSFAGVLTRVVCTMMQMVDERSLTVPEVAEALRVSEWTIRQWLRSGRLRGYRPGGTKIGWRLRESAPAPVHSRP